jgi:hypothetical protein
MKVLPPMVWVIPDPESFALMVTIDECDKDYVLRDLHTPIITQRQRPVKRRVLDWTPQVDNLEALLKKAGHLFRGNVLMHACDSSVIRLINMSL